MTTTNPAALPLNCPVAQVLRRATTADTEALVALNTSVHRWPQLPPNLPVGTWTRDLLRGSHPTTGPGDFLVVEEAATSRLVSTLCLITQTWSYDGIPFTAGQPELVGTLPEFRQRAGSREIFATVRMQGAARAVNCCKGSVVFPGITANSATNRRSRWGPGGSGRSRVSLRCVRGRMNHIGCAPRLRPIAIPLLRRLVRWDGARYRLAAVRDEAAWRYELAGHLLESVTARRAHSP